MGASHMYSMCYTHACTFLGLYKYATPLNANISVRKPKDKDAAIVLTTRRAIAMVVSRAMRHPPMRK